VSSLSYGEVHSNLSPVHLYSIESLAGISSILNTFEIDEGKAPAPAAVAVQHHLDLLEVSVPPELLLQLPLCGVEAQAKHSNTLAGLRLVSVAHMPPPRGHW